MDWKEQYALDLEALKNPAPGDYWHEMFCGAYIVLAVGPETVTVCETKIPTDKHHWTWDITKTRRMLREDFNKELRYKSETMKDKTWCNVIRSPGYMPFVTAFQKLQPV